MAEDRAATIIDKGLHFRGDLVSDEDITVRGRFTGNIATSGCLRVEPGGFVHGDVTASDVILEGSIQGSVTVAGQFDLRRPGRMLGDVKASVVTIAARAFLRGKVLATEKMSAQGRSLRRKIRAHQPASTATRSQAGRR